MGQQLLAHFQGESTAHAQKLFLLEHKGDLGKFNADFTKVAAAAQPIVGEWGVKKRYLEALKPPSLAVHLRTWMHEPL